MSNTGYFQYNLRSVVHSGVGSIIRIPALLQGLGARRVLLISDAGLQGAGVVDRVASTFDNWQSGNVPTLAGTFAEITPDAGGNCINEADGHFCQDGICQEPGCPLVKRAAVVWKGRCA